MLAEDYEYVIGGDPDRDTIDLAVLDTATGRTRNVVAVGTDAGWFSQAAVAVKEAAQGNS